MKSATQCLKAPEIQALLSGAASHVQSKIWEEHVSACEHCRAALAGSIGDEDWWHEAEQSLMGLQELTKTWDVLEHPNPLTAKNFTVEAGNEAQVGKGILTFRAFSGARKTGVGADKIPYPRQDHSGRLFATKPYTIEKARVCPYNKKVLV